MQIEFLRTAYMKMNVRDLSRAFNRKFDTKKTECALKSALKKHGILCGRTGRDRLISPRRIYSDEQVQFVRDNCPHMPKKELLKRFNARFGTEITLSKLKALMANRKVNSGRTGCFPKGHRPWNYGTKGQGLTGPNKKSFKKGNIPPNRKPLWHERICSKDGFILMKVPEKNPYTGFPTRYKHKHVWVWEQEHGPVPDGHVVFFIDGDKTNCVPGNLMLIQRAELLRLNQHGYKDAPEELKPSILALSRLQVKAWAKKRGASCETDTS